MGKMLETKIGATTAQGIDTIIMNGKDPSALYEIVRGKNVETLFVGRRTQ